MENIPDGWVKTKLSEVTVLSNEKVHPSEVEGEFYVGLEHIESGSNRIIGHGFASETKSTKTTFQKGDVLYGKLRPYLNKVALAEFDGVCSTDILVYSPSGVIENNFLVRFLSQADFVDYADQNSKGVNLPRTSYQAIGEYSINLPPLGEQKRIADKIDTVFDRTNEVATALKENLHLVNEYKSSVFNMLFRSGLKNSKDRKNFSAISIGLPTTKLNKGWKWTKLSNVARLESGHTPRKSNPHFWNNGDVPWISLKDIRAADQTTIYDTSQMPNSAGLDNSSARLLPKGTVVLSRDISVGFVTIMGREMATSQHFANWVCGEEINNYFLQYALASSRDYLKSTGQGTTVKTIYMPALKDFYIALPSLNVQVEFVQAIQNSFHTIDQIRSLSEKCEEQLLTFNQSILRKAFLGELVHQDSGDEPATDLLRQHKIQPKRLTRKPKIKKSIAKTQPNGRNSKMIIPVRVALMQSIKPLSAQQLLSAAGYPNNADTDQIEQFFLDIRQAITNSEIEVWREGDQDYFAVSGEANEG